jgi:Ca2+:H+ antiporter
VRCQRPGGRAELPDGSGRAVYGPVLAIAALVLTWGRDLPPPLIVLVALFLTGAVPAAVHHAEVVAHKAGPGPLLLGLGGTHMVLPALTLVVGTPTVVPGRADVLQAGVHLGLLGAFLFLAASP